MKVKCIYCDEEKEEYVSEICEECAIKNDEWINGEFEE